MKDTYLKNTIPCEVIQDLLPSYIEELTSPVTNEYVKEHLEECDICHAICDDMKTMPEEQEQSQAKEIDYLKQVRKQHNRRLWVVGILCFVLAAAWIVASPYCMGTNMALELVDYNIEVKENQLHVTALPVENETAIAKVKAIEEEPGVLELVFTGVKAKPWEAGNALDLSKELNCEASERITKIICDGTLIWYDGQSISRITSEVYDSRHDYAGDMSANGRTVGALNLVNYLGNFTNELETSQVPYGWTLYMENAYSSLRKEQLEKRMRGYAYAMLAVIDNLDTVRFSYTIVKEDNFHEECLLEITSKDASEYAGYYIKEAAKDPGLLQELMEKSGLTEEHYFTEDGSSTSAAQNTIALNLVNLTEEELGSISIDFYV